MKQTSRKLALAAAVLTLLAAQEVKADLLVNGDFQTGDLTGWTTFTTANGSNGTGLPDVVSFDTSGTGASLAAHFNIGQAVFNMGQPEGGGIFQDVATGAGTFTITGLLASQDSPMGPNSDLGTFSVLVDGVTEQTFQLGVSPGANAIVRDSFDVTFSIATAGTHEIQFLITRPFTNGLGSTPEQYLDDLTLNGPSPSVPEPSTMLLGGFGAVVVLGWQGVRRRKSLNA
jgi:hypothetical protein